MVIFCPYLHIHAICEGFADSILFAVCCFDVSCLFLVAKYDSPARLTKLKCLQVLHFS